MLTRDLTIDFQIAACMLVSFDQTYVGLLLTTAPFSAAIVDEGERRKKIKELNRKLPSCNFAVLSRLMRHLNNGAGLAKIIEG